MNNFLTKSKCRLSYLISTLSYLNQTKKAINNTQLLIARLLIEQIKNKGVCSSIQEAEFKVYSQFGDDGIIQYLINIINLKIYEKRFVEIGVENYLESNTRFLLINNNWDGLLLDSDTKNTSFIKRDEIYWKHNITAVCKFITIENIQNILKTHKFDHDLGILSLDIDGNDYWIWRAIKTVRPVIVIIEYNSLYGPNEAVTVPYKSNFDRFREHFSGLYWGSSLKALCLLGKEKGYTFIGTDSAGNNAYFIRNDRVRKLKKKTPKTGFTVSKY